MDSWQLFTDGEVKKWGRGGSLTTWYPLGSTDCIFHSWLVPLHEETDMQPLYWRCGCWSLRHKLLGRSRWSVIRVQRKEEFNIVGTFRVLTGNIHWNELWITFSESSLKVIKKVLAVMLRVCWHFFDKKKFKFKNVTISYKNMLQPVFRHHNIFRARSCSTNHLPRMLFLLS